MKAVKIILIISIGLFVLSLTQTAVFMNKGGDDNYMLSIACLLLGWAEVFEGGIAWLANPLLFISWILFLIKQTRITAFISLAALLLSLSYLSASTITIDEGGNKADIISYGAGYYLWVLSSLSLFIGCIWIIISGKKTNKNTPAL
ncbi:hypothetical protein [Elizabethkingia meningoseptica]|uniref:hypothetical protein n=1 Tax=Elizabethkingia meningoseptica TaxID=238 RepID=UPI0009372FA8|nr:hypothetical protein [Elizabethkingia meningoseptica]